MKRNLRADELNPPTVFGGFPPFQGGKYSAKFGFNHNLKQLLKPCGSKGVPEREAVLPKARLKG